MNNVIVCFDYADDGERELTHLSYIPSSEEVRISTANYLANFYDEVYFAKELPLDFVGQYLKAIIGSDKLTRIENNS